jgi:hypothetical protein
LKAFFASPRTQQQADAVKGLPVLLSYATWAPWLAKGYVSSFSSLLIDSGAYSEHTGAATVDLSMYLAWKDQFQPHHVAAWAGLDDINGNWKRSLSNYRRGGFPTMHDEDPDELLEDLIPIAREAGGWIGIGLKPPRHGRENWLKRTLDRMPDDLHVHGFALRAYSYLPRLDSVDSTTWIFDAMRVRQHNGAFMTYGEAIDIVVNRIVRVPRIPKFEKDFGQETLDFGDGPDLSLGTVPKNCA